MGREVSFDAASNDIVREFRFRQGDLDSDDTKSGINLLDATNMIFDHVSVQFAQWNNIDAVGACNITVMNSIDANPIGQQFTPTPRRGPTPGTATCSPTRTTGTRWPRPTRSTSTTSSTTSRPGYTAGNTGGLFTHDLVNNYFITGPATTSASDAHLPGQYPGSSTSRATCSTATRTVRSTAADGRARRHDRAVRPLVADHRDDPDATAAAAYASVVADAGASLHRDQVDTLVIADADLARQVGEPLDASDQHGPDQQRLRDADGRRRPPPTPTATGCPTPGRPDTASTRTAPSDATGDFDHTGYTNIEKYINGLIDGSYPCRTQRLSGRRGG